MSVENTASSTCTVHIEEIMPLITERLSAGQSVCFSPRGISMLPMLKQGRDTVTLTAVTKPLKKYDIPLYRRDNGKYVLHRIIKIGESFTCIGDNQFTAEQDIKKEQIIAIVSAFTRNGKEYSVDNLCYKIYCRFWHFSRFPRRCIRALFLRIKRLF